MVATLFVLTGAIAHAAMYHLWHWRGLRTKRLHFWAAVWCADTILFLVGRLVTVTAGDQAGVVTGIRLAWTSAALLIVAGIGLGGALVERAQRRLLLTTVAFAGVMVVLIATTDLVVPARCTSAPTGWDRRRRRSGRDRCCRSSAWRSSWPSSTSSRR